MDLATSILGWNVGGIECLNEIRKSVIARHWRQIHSRVGRHYVGRNTLIVSSVRPLQDHTLARALRAATNGVIAVWVGVVKASFSLWKCNLVIGRGQDLHDSQELRASVNWIYEKISCDALVPWDHAVISAAGQLLVCASLEGASIVPAGWPKGAGAICRSRKPPDERAG